MIILRRSEKPSIYTDKNKIPHVHLTFDSSGAPAAENDHSTEVEKNRFVEQEDLQPAYDSAVVKVADKKVVAKKLGRGYTGIKVLQGIGSALEDVSSTSFLILIPADR